MKDNEDRFASMRFIINVPNEERNTFLAAKKFYYNTVKNHHTLEIKDNTYDFEGNFVKNFFGVFVAFREDEEKDISFFWQEFKRLKDNNNIS